MHLTAHRFRHTIATRMINENIPEIAVQQMLDHSSPAMTRVYAKIHDATLRREYDRYQERLNIRGEVVKLDPAGPLSDAAWAKERLGRAKLTLPNGYCGRPLQSHCPHPNACLTCPDFLTTGEHLPAHRDQLANTLELIDTARAAGHERLVEQNEQIKLNLIRIIEGLETLPQPEEARCLLTAQRGFGPPPHANVSWRRHARARRRENSISVARMSPSRASLATPACRDNGSTNSRPARRDRAAPRRSAIDLGSECRPRSRPATLAAPAHRDARDENRRLREENTALKAELALAYGADETRRPLPADDSRSACFPTRSELAHSSTLVPA